MPLVERNQVVKAITADGLQILIRSATRARMWRSTSACAVPILADVLPGGLTTPEDRPPQLCSGDFGALVRPIRREEHAR